TTVLVTAQRHTRTGGVGNQRLISVSRVRCNEPTRRLVPGTSPDGAGHNRRIDYKGHSNGGKDGEQAAAKPVAGDPAPAGRYPPRGNAGHEWPQEPSGALRGEVECEP